VTSLASAIRARPATAPRPAWVFVADRGQWCVLRCASAGERIVTLCLLELPPDPVYVATVRPHNTCPACETELAAGTPAAVALPETLPDEATEPRTITRDLRPAHRRCDPVRAWDGDGAFVHLEDV